MCFLKLVELCLVVVLVVGELCSVVFGVLFGGLGFVVLFFDGVCVYVFVFVMCFDQQVVDVVGDELNVVDGVVVVGYDVVDDVWVRVGVGQCDDGNFEFVGFLYGDDFFGGVYYEDCVGQVVYFVDVVDEMQQVFVFVGELDVFGFGVVVDVFGFEQVVEFVEVVNVGVYCFEVGEYVVQLVVGYVGYVGVVGFQFYDFLGLFFGVYEQDDVVVFGEVFDVVEVVVYLFEGFLQVDDENVVVFGKDEFFEFWVLVFGFVVEVNFGFEQLFYVDV